MEVCVDFLHGCQSTSVEASTNFNRTKLTFMEISIEVNSTKVHGSISTSMEVSNIFFGS